MEIASIYLKTGKPANGPTGKPADGPTLRRSTLAHGKWTLGIQDLRFRMQDARWVLDTGNWLFGANYGRLTVEEFPVTEYQIPNTEYL